MAFPVKGGLRPENQGIIHQGNPYPHENKYFSCLNTEAEIASTHGIYVGKTKVFISHTLSLSLSLSSERDLQNVSKTANLSGTWGEIQSP
jgi:hypothetical protein